MTDLLHTIPGFPTKTYAHLLPSLEKHLVTTTDLLTLDALDIAKRAQLPLLDVRRLINHVVTILQSQLGLSQGPDCSDFQGSLRKSGKETVGKWGTISLIDDSLDGAIGGGIPTGYVTEITGESGAGKTQLLLTLLLSAQLPPPHGLSRPTLYISTEHALPTTRLMQLLSKHHILSAHPSSPSLSQILTLQTPDLESQEHILTYQLPIALERHNIGLCIIDSITANYRAEGSKDFISNSPSALAQRSGQLVRLGGLLRSLAFIHNCAIVVANQVADRFLPAISSRPFSPTHSSSQRQASIQPRQYTSSAHALHSDTPPSDQTTTPILSLDHQQRFFTGWGDHPTRSINPKTPSLGLVWTNQIACRIALIKEPDYVGAGASRAENEEEGEEEKNAEWAPKRWRRWMKLVFAPWAEEAEVGSRGVEFELWAGGVRAVRNENTSSRLLMDKQ